MGEFSGRGGLLQAAGLCVSGVFSGGEEGAGGGTTGEREGRGRGVEDDGGGLHFFVVGWLVVSVR